MVFLVEVAGNELNVGWPTHEDFVTITWPLSIIGASVHFRDQCGVFVTGAFHPVF